MNTFRLEPSATKNKRSRKLCSSSNQIMTLMVAISIALMLISFCSLNKIGDHHFRDEQPMRSIVSLQEQKDSSVSKPEQLQPSRHLRSLSSSLDDQRQRKSNHPEEGVFLLGIFTTKDSAMESQRRKMIRKTYLSYDLNSGSVATARHHNYSKNRNSSSPIMTVHDDEKISEKVICSIGEFRKARYENCRIVYTFVLGGADHNHAPTDLSQDHRSPLPPPILTFNNKDHDIGKNQYEENYEDMTFLNINENMNQGKSISWFYYASNYLAKEFNINYIAKIDTDALLYPNRLLPYLERRLDIISDAATMTSITSRHQQQASVKNVYGGVLANPDQPFIHYNYMQGGFYFLSIALAGWIASPNCRRNQIVEADMKRRSGKRHEDAEIGLFVLAAREEQVNQQEGTEVYWINFDDDHDNENTVAKGRDVFWHNGKLKRVDGLEKMYDAFLAQERAMAWLEELQSKHGNCPNEGILLQSMASLDDGAKKQFLTLTQKLTLSCQS